MRRISIERYAEEPQVRAGDGEGNYHLEPQSDHCAGLVEGVRDDGTRWVMFLDKVGSPAMFWAVREEDGSVVGDPVFLA